MPNLKSVLILLCLLSSVAHAELTPEQATTSIRDRLAREWTSVVDAEKAFGWRVDYRGKTYRGDWVVHVGGWRYFFDRGEVRCRLQTDEHMNCNNGEFVKPVWSTSDAKPAVTLTTLVMLQRGMWGKGLGVRIDRENGWHATIETTISTPDAASRTSARYRADVKFAVDGTFTVGLPSLVERYSETCFSASGCYSTHWTCMRTDALPRR